jgi:hypothetical protein
MKGFKMSQDSEINFNSQAVTQDTLVSTVDDPGKYEVQLFEEGDGPAPKELPRVTYAPEEEKRRKRTGLISRFFTLVQAWGVTQVAWEDENRLSLIISTGDVGGVSFADNPSNLTSVGLASGVGVGHCFAGMTMTLEGFTGPLYMYPDTDGVDAVTTSVVAITVQK